MPPDDYLSKPLDPGMLLQKLAELSSAERTVNGRDETSPNDMFNSEQFETLKRHLSCEEVSQYVSLFLENITEQLSKIQTLAGRGDLVGLGSEAHKLLGAAGNIGATGIGRIASTLCTACREKDHDEALRLVVDLQAEIATASSACRSWLGIIRHA